MNQTENDTPQVFLFNTLKEEIDLKLLKKVRHIELEHNLFKHGWRIELDLSEQALREDSLHLFKVIADAWLYTLHRYSLSFMDATAIVQYREYQKWKRVEFNIHSAGRIELISVESLEEMEELRCRHL